MFSSKRNDYIEAKSVNIILFRWTKTRNIELELIPFFFIPFIEKKLQFLQRWLCLKKGFDFWTLLLISEYFNGTTIMKANLFKNLLGKLFYEKVRVRISKYTF